MFVSSSQESLIEFGGKYWGVNFFIRRQIYFLILEPLITYASRSFYPFLGIAAKNRLRSIQRRALLYVTALYRTTSGRILNQLAGIPPIDLAIEKMMVKDDILSGGLEYNFGSENVKLDNFEQRLVEMECNPIHYLDLRDNIHIYGKYNGRASWKIFTDGSKMKEGVGCGFIVFHMGIKQAEFSYKLSFKNSIFQAEVLAIYKSMLYIKENNLLDVIVYTDSQSTLKALISVNSSNGMIRKMRKELNILGIHLVWIKAHAGHELADELAKRAIIEGQDISIPYPISYLNFLVKNKLLQDWQEIWDKNIESFCYRVFTRVSNKYRSFNRSVAAFITGHGPFPQYAFKMRFVDSPFCVCGRVGTPLHYIFQCEKTLNYHLPFPSNLEGQIAWFRIQMGRDTLNELYRFLQVNNVELRKGAPILRDRDMSSDSD